MRPLRVIPLSVVTWLVLSAAPAVAVCGDGCDTGLDVLSPGEYLWPAQTVTWNADVYTDKSAGGPNDDPFFAYLVEPNQRAARVKTAERGDVSQSGLAGGIVVLVLGGWFIRERARTRKSLAPEDIHRARP